MSLPDPELRKLADRLLDAARTGTPIPPLTSEHPDLDVADAYAIQSAVIESMLAAGDSIAGYKLGLTSKPMQELLGVHEPDYAPLLASAVIDDGAALLLGRFIAPKVEAEIALVLRETLTGPGVTLAQAEQAVGGAVAAIEIVDSRIADWKIKLPDTVADLASSGATVLGREVVPVDGFDIRLVGMAVTKNDELIATGAGAAALGNPIGAVAWLANTLAAYGVSLEAGRFVMTGSLHGAFSVSRGDVVRAEFDRLGTVSVRLT
jgi:2-keto-4-pentenoate hydratase